jgi:hypothetical protein
MNTIDIMENYNSTVDQCGAVGDIVRGGALGLDEG